jgi:hypothetical protein
LIKKQGEREMEKGKVEGASIEALNGMADIMHELQLSLEPIRDKALDEKARITGYAQCAEQMLQVNYPRRCY